MDVEEQNQFVVQLEKLLTSQVALTQWSHTMDLLALSTFDNLVELYRISYKAQKVFQAEEAHQIKTLAFSPDSQMLAYGLTDGTIRIIKTENGEKIVSLEGQQQEGVERDIMNFVPFCQLESTLFMPFQKGSMESKLILNISPYKNCNKNALVKINYFADLKPNFTLLLTSNRSTTYIYLNGFIPFAQLNFQSLGYKNSRVLHNYFDSSFHMIIQQEGHKSSKIWYATSTPQVLSSQKESLIKSSCLSGELSQILVYLETAYTAAEGIVEGALRQYNSKLRLIDDPNIENIRPCEELFKFLNCGSASTAVVTFFTKEVYDTKILEKLDEALNTAFAHLHDLLLESIQNALERAMILLSKLKNLAEATPSLGLKYSDLKSIESKLIKLYTMGDVLLVESTQAKFDIRNLLVWLNKATIRSSGQNEAQIQNSKSYLNKYTVDFSRLHSFLQNQDRFLLKNLLAFFEKNNLSHNIVLQKPEFRVLAGEKKKKDYDQQQFQRIARMFDVQDQQEVSDEKMDVEQSYRSFRIQVKQTLSLWRASSKNPVDRLSAVLSRNWQKRYVGQLAVSELFPVELKTIVLNNQLLVYMIQRKSEQQWLVRYNCRTNEKRWLRLRNGHILSMAVAESVLLVIEDIQTGRKIVGQVVNEQFNEGEVVIGKRISKAEGELDINASLRGLNSLVIDKNKLIVFD